MKNNYLRDAGHQRKGKRKMQGGTPCRGTLCVTMQENLLPPKGGYEMRKRMLRAGFAYRHRQGRQQGSTDR